MTHLACVIPFFNGSETIGRALDSVLRSSLCDEVIVVSDASPQPIRSSLSPLHLASEREGRLKIFEMTNNLGQGAARNIGASLAQSTWLSFLDQDDEILPPFHVQALSCLTQLSATAAVETQAEIVGPKGPVIDPVDPRYSMILASVPWNIVVHRSAFWTSGGFPTEPIFRGDAAGEDIAFKSALKACFPVRRLQVRGVRHHVRAGSATDRFLERSTVADSGEVIFRWKYPAEKDGSLAAAVGRHVERALEQRNSMVRVLASKSG